MAKPLANYPGAIEPDVGDVNSTAAAQVAGGASSISQKFDTHDHTAGKGLPVPFSALTGDATLDANSNAITAVAYLTFKPIAAASAPDFALFVDVADQRLKYRDNTGTLRTITWTP